MASSSLVNIRDFIFTSLLASWCIKCSNATLTQYLRLYFHKMLVFCEIRENIVPWKKELIRQMVPKCCYKMKINPKAFAILFLAVAIYLMYVIAVRIGSKCVYTCTSILFWLLVYTHSYSYVCILGWKWLIAS